MQHIIPFFNHPHFTLKMSSAAAINDEIAALEHTLKEKRQQAADALKADADTRDFYNSRLNAHLAYMTPQIVQDMLDTKHNELLENVHKQMDKYKTTILHELDCVKKLAECKSDEICYHMQPFTLNEWYDGYGGNPAGQYSYDLICKKCNTCIGDVHFNPKQNTIREVRFKNPALNAVFPKENIQF